MVILNTGIEDHGILECVKSGAINFQENCEEFLDLGDLDLRMDTLGHETHAACVLFRTAPNVSIYVARVVDDNECISSQNGYKVTL